MRKLKIKPGVSYRGEKIDIPCYDLEAYIAEKEKEIINKVKAGDKEEKNNFVKINLPFIVSQAEKYLNNGLTLEELINKGKTALLKSINDYDETRGMGLIAFAHLMVSESMKEVIEEKKEGNK
ncbi:MAG: hypothetical protein J1F67_10925 [Muribaculaceae bacterium]|nr:hypothetical protein [Muribaculaceae bacterium]